MKIYCIIALHPTNYRRARFFSYKLLPKSFVNLSYLIINYSNVM